MSANQLGIKSLVSMLLHRKRLWCTDLVPHLPRVGDQKYYLCRYRDKLLSPSLITTEVSSSGVRERIRLGEGRGIPTARVIMTKVSMQ